MMWHAPGLLDKLLRLSNVVDWNAKPTESMYALFEDLSERFEVQRSRLNQVIEEEVVPVLSR
jgi:hypothetical protein